MSDTALTGFDASPDKIADALDAPAADIRNGDAHLTGYDDQIDLYMGDPIEWDLSISFTCMGEALYRDVAGSHVIEDDT